MDYFDYVHKLTCWSEQITEMANVCVGGTGTTVAALDAQINSDANLLTLHMRMPHQKSDEAKLLAMLAAYAFVPYGNLGEQAVIQETGRLPEAQYRCMRWVLDSNNLAISEELDESLRIVAGLTPCETYRKEPADLIRLLIEKHTLQTLLMGDARYGMSDIEQAEGDAMFELGQALMEDSDRETIPAELLLEPLQRLTKDPEYMPFVHRWLEKPDLPLLRFVRKQKELAQ